jgi:uncharacterized protein (DUF2249 family)
MSREVLLDVSELEPPEPLTLTLDAAEQLQPGQYLRMLHRREPYPLYGHLDEQHFRHYTRPGTRAAVEVFIWSENDAEAAAAVQAIIAASRAQ